jgi:hypothetical protein
MSSWTFVPHDDVSRSVRFPGPNHKQCAEQRQPSFHASPKVSTVMRTFAKRTKKEHQNRALSMGAIRGPGPRKQKTVIFKTFRPLL